MRSPAGTSWIRADMPMSGKRLYGAQTWPERAMSGLRDEEHGDERGVVWLTDLSGGSMQPAPT
jgi:hypothetical protein